MPDPYSLGFPLGIFFKGTTHHIGSRLSHSYSSRGSPGQGLKFESLLEGSLSFTQTFPQ